MKLWQRHVLGALLGALLIAPSVPWIAAAWGNSPLDRAGPLFAALALAWWATVAFFCRPRGSGIDASALPLGLLFAAVAGAGVYLDIHVLVAAGSVGLAWSLLWALGGSTAGLLLLPSLVAGMFALPTTTFIIDEIALSLGLPSPGGIQVKLWLAAAVTAAGAAGLAAHRFGWDPRIGAYGTGVAAVALLAAVGLFFAFRPPSFGPAVKLDESEWAFGRWLGAEIGASPVEQRLFQGARLSKRAYARPDGHRVAVLIVESEDVHRLHAPEYCLSGGGWTMRERSGSPWAVGDPGAAAAELVAYRGDSRLKGVYWFTSNSRSTTDLPGLRLQSRLRPDEPFTLYMVTAISDDGETSDQVLSAFLAEAPWLRPLPGRVSAGASL